MPDSNLSCRLAIAQRFSFRASFPFPKYSETYWRLPAQRTSRIGPTNFSSPIRRSETFGLIRRFLSAIVR